MSIPKRNYFTFTSNNGLFVRVLADQNAANMTGGFGGWEVIDRPKRVGMTRFKGKDPFRADIPILFDGWQDSVSQEIDISTLARMAEQPGPGQAPPSLRVDGPFPREDLTWVIETIDWDNSRTIYDEIGGTPCRVRAAAIVHLLQLVDDQVIVTPPTLKIVSNKKGSKTKPSSGKSVKHEAQIEYGDPSQWPLIAQANPLIFFPFGSVDPRAPIPPGKTINIPNYPGHEVAPRGRR